MKQRAIVIGITILMNLSLIGQNFISPNKQWNVRLSGGIGLTTEIFKIEGDSLLNSTSYSKIWVSFDSLFTWKYQGLLREDSNIVYFIPPNESEGILYDFNLNVGDTVIVNNIFCNDIPVTIIGIDTVEYFGISRKRWAIGEDGYVNEFWVEGIGSLNGPLYTRFGYCIICPVWELLCYHYYDTLEYIMYPETDCYQSTVGINDKFGEVENDFVIKPNPVVRGTTLYLEIATEPISIDIHNSSGVLIKTINTDYNNGIETNTLLPGLYFITIKTKDNSIRTKKLLIQ